MKYQITYETNDGGSGNATVEETEMLKIIATLENSGCFNIVVKRIYEEDPCDRCNRYYTTCDSCPYLKEE